MTEGPKLARAVVFELPEYVPGKPLEELERELGIRDAIKLASNENPLGPSPAAVAAIGRAVARLALYPEASSPQLRRAIAARHQLAEEWVIPSNGGDDAITLVAQTFIEPGEAALVPEPGFGAYSHAVRLCGGRPLPYTLDPPGFRYEVGCILDLARRVRPKLVFVCNPNNPTGTAFSGDELRELSHALPDGTLLVVDEAYRDFADPWVVEAAPWVASGFDLVVLRTFSKLYGLAGLRLGYALARPDLAALMDRVREPFAVNRLAQEAGVAALGDTDHVTRTLEVVREGRARLTEALEGRGLSVVPSQANFILVDLGRPAGLVYDGLLTRGVIVRSGTTWNLPTFLRVTIGTPPQVERFLAALDEVLAG